MFFCALPVCSWFSFLFSPAQVAPLFAHADFSSCIFSLRVGYHPHVIYCFRNVGEMPIKTSLKPPHPDLNIFAPQFKGMTCNLCICLSLQQPPSCINKAKTVSFSIIILYLSLCRKPCPFFRSKIIRFHIF